MRRLFRTLAALSCALLLLGNNNCSKNSTSNTPQFVTTISIEDAGGAAATSFVPGANIQFVLTIRNRSATTQILYFNSSEQTNITVVQAGTANVVWNSDNNTTPDTSQFTTLTLQPEGSAGDTQTVPIVWNQLDNSGNAVASGNYEVLGGFTVFNTTGPGSSADNGNSMAMGAPTSDQMFPTVFRSTLTPFTIQ